MSLPANPSRRAFTLLEVIVATMILGFLGITLHRFLTSNLAAIRLSTELEDERTALQSVVEIVRTQLRDLPLHGVDSISGRPNKFHGLSNDEITWRCTAGAGVLTTAAPGMYCVTLTVQPADERSPITELGLRREAVQPALNSVAFFDRGGGEHRYNWLPLIRPMAALEIRYFDGQNHSWQDTWTDANRRPELVRVRLWRKPDDAPLDAILPVPSARLEP